MSSSLIVVTPPWPVLQSLQQRINEASSWCYPSGSSPQPPSWFCALKQCYRCLYPNIILLWQIRELIKVASEATATMKSMDTHCKMKGFLFYYCVQKCRGLMTQNTSLIHVFTFPAALLIFLLSSISLFFFLNLVLLAPVADLHHIH